MSEFPQLLANGHMDVAAKAIGLNERDQATALNEFLKNGGQNLDPATTAWCAAFVDATLRQSGQQGTGKLNARSYLDWGQEVDQPQRGDVAVFSRGDPNGWQGHVGFFEGFDDNGNIRVLGGNQGDAVNIASYSADQLLGFRRGQGGGTPAPAGGLDGLAPMAPPPPMGFAETLAGRMGAGRPARPAGPAPITPLPKNIQGQNPQDFAAILEQIQAATAAPKLKPLG